LLSGATDDSTKAMKHGNIKLVTAILRKGIEVHQETDVCLERG